MGSQGERWMRQPQWEMPSATGQGRDRSSRNLPTEAATEAPSAPPHPQGGTGSVRGSGGRRSTRPCPPAPRPPSAPSAAHYCRQPSGRATTRSPQELLNIVEKSSSRKGREAGETGAGTVCGGTDGTAGLAGGGGWGAIAFKPGRDEDGGHKSISALVPVLSSQSRHLRQRERPHAPAAHRVR